MSLQSVGGATTFERIDAGTNLNRTCIHFVPKGFKSSLFSATRGASTAAGVILIIEQSVKYQDSNIVTHAVSQVEMGDFSLYSNFTTPFTISNPNGLEMFFTIGVQGRSANQSAAGGINFIDTPI